MSRMFKSITQTWNVFVGCNFECTYCNARKAALTRFKHFPRYKDGFYPHLVPKELTRTFKPDEFIMVPYMGDISFADRPTAALILSKLWHYPLTNFLMCSKNPLVFSTWGFEIPPNVYLGTTIESNRDYGLSKAPPPVQRFSDLRAYLHNAKFLSIEPIMDFDLDVLTRWVRHIKPYIIEVGADNYHNNLPEPSPEKLEQLLANLRLICPRVIEKHGLERLKKRR